MTHEKKKQDDKKADPKDARKDTGSEKDKGRECAHDAGILAKKRKKVSVSSEELDQLKKQSDAYKEVHDKWLRLNAEFENYKRRMAKDKSDFMKFAQEDIMFEFLQVLDNFGRAKDSIANASDIKSISEGVAMIFAQLMGVLEKKGLKSIDAVGKMFDPAHHEAIGFIDSDEHPDHTVLTEVQKGYMLNGRLLRPSLVQISRAVKGQSSQAPDAPSDGELDSQQPETGLPEKEKRTT